MNGAARDGAGLVREAFLAYREGFARSTARARDSFARADWAALRRDSSERLDLYGACLAGALDGLRARLGERVHERPLWHAANRAFAQAVAGLPDAELAQTFFNSVTRRVFATAGVDPAIEFVELAFPPQPAPEAVARTCRRRHDTAGLVARLLAHHALPCGFEDLGRDATLVAAELDARDPSPVEAIDSARPLFYRNRRAYVVGRVRRVSGSVHPIVIPLAERDRPRRRRRRAAHRGRGQRSCSASRARTSSSRRSTRASWSTSWARSCRASRSRSCTTRSATTGTARPSSTARCYEHLVRSDDAFELAAGQARHGDARVHAAGLRRRVQGHPRPLRAAQDGDARRT